MFWECSKLKNVLEWYIKEDGTVEVDGLNDTSISEIVIPDKIVGRKVTSIGEYAFDNCSNITSVEIPNCVTIIKADAFSDCNLEKVYITSGSYAETWVKENYPDKIQYK